MWTFGYVWNQLLVDFLNNKKKSKMQQKLLLFKKLLKTFENIWKWNSFGKLWIKIFIIV
jgi:hypothetical protein